MKRLSNRTILAVALAAAWPIAPALAAASLQEMQSRDRSQDEEPPLQLIVAYRMKMPATPMPAPSPGSPQEAPQVAQLPRDPRGVAARRATVDPVLSARPDQLPPVPPVARMQAEIPPAPAPANSSVAVLAEALGNGPADAVVNAELARFPTMPVRLYTLPPAPPPIPSPTAPVQLVVPSRDTRADTRSVLRW